MKQVFILLTGLTIIYMMTVVFANSVMEDLSENIIRLHIVANSDEDIDQQIKLKIRDEILRADINVEDKASAIFNMRKIEKIANDVLFENGFSYGAKVNFGNFKFPEKSYDEITLPEGSYYGINVILGNGNGKNWWCVLSPPACIMEGCVKFDDEALKSRLQDETFMVISNNYQYKSKIVEIFKNLF